MSKELPYFKFFCSEWNDGDITLEDYNTQGLFISICSYYWLKNCDVSLVKLKKKFKKEEETINSLIKEDIIIVENGSVVISFLIEQLDERGNLSNQNSKNAKKRWDKVRKQKQEENESYATASNSHSENSTESIQYREDKIKEDKIRKENIISQQIWIESICMKKKLNFDFCIVYLSNFLDDLELKDELDKPEKDIKRHFVNWLNIELKKEKDSDKKEKSFSEKLFGQEKHDKILEQLNQIDIDNEQNLLS